MNKEYSKPKLSKHGKLEQLTQTGMAVMTGALDALVGGQFSS